MTLPIKPTYLPMEAQVAARLPEGPEWQYEPKWDGFRCLAFRDGDVVHLQSKSQKSLTRYFPELVAALAQLKAPAFVLDGEIVITVDGRYSFDDLLMRIHPSATRVEKLSRETPCRFLVFDLLVDAQRESLVALPLRLRRQRLESFAKRFVRRNAVVTLSPSTGDVSEARQWLAGEEGTDGVVAKRADLPYQSGERTGMQKIKRQRSADCVVGGFRYLERERLVGSLLLGLYNGDGLLDHVGFTSSIRDNERAQLTRRCERLVHPPGFTGRAPGGPSRWSTKRSTEWQPMRPKLVVEVQFDHFAGDRFRHGTKLLRFRPDKAPGDCTLKAVRRESGVGRS